MSHLKKFVTTSVLSVAASTSIAADQCPQYEVNGLVRGDSLGRYVPGIDGRTNQGIPFQKCLNACLQAKGCL